MARCWKSVASGKAAAKARRIRDAVSITRVPSLRRRRRMVANSAVANACALGIASRTVSINQIGGGVQNEPHRWASGERQLVLSEAS